MLLRNRVNGIQAETQPPRNAFINFGGEPRLEYACQQIRANTTTRIADCYARPAILLADLNAQTPSFAKTHRLDRILQQLDKGLLELPGFAEHHWCVVWYIERHLHIAFLKA